MNQSFVCFCFCFYFPFGFPRSMQGKMIRTSILQVHTVVPSREEKTLTTFGKVKIIIPTQRLRFRASGTEVI
ncbi:hypothetical protein BDV40DRAFT_279094, partial [Aspergillus tamarii]